MNRKQVFRIGTAVIFFAVFQSPITYLVLGKIEDGKVTEIVFEKEGIAILPLSTYPKIHFEYQNKEYSFFGEENQAFLVGEDVKVIFYSWKPQEAKIYSFWGLFIDSIIQLPIGLLIWWAFFKSYPKMFNSSNEP